MTSLREIGEKANPPRDACGSATHPDEPLLLCMGAKFLPKKAGRRPRWADLTAPFPVSAPARRSSTSTSDSNHAAMPLQHSPDPAGPAWAQECSADYLIFYSSREEGGNLWCPVRGFPQ